MSGHSKWHNIQAKKGKADAARGKIFTKLGREILVAVKVGGPDPVSNSKLKDVIAKCKANNMPNDTINNAIKKASGEGSNKVYEEMIYEGYGINGIAVYVEASTDNKNRTAADVRHVFDKATAKMSEDDIMMLAIENGADDFKADEECYEITTTPSEFSVVREALENAGIEFVEAEVQMVPSTTVELDDASAEKMQRLIDNLEDLDDVMNVYHNWAE